MDPIQRLSGTPTMTLESTTASIAKASGVSALSVTFSSWLGLDYSWLSFDEMMGCA